MKPIETPVEEFEHWYDEDLHNNAIALRKYCQALVDEMGLECEDEFTRDGELLRVHTIDTYSKHASTNIVVSKIVPDGAQTPHNETAEVSIRDLYRDWKQGTAVPAETEPTLAQQDSSPQQSIPQ